MTPMASWKLNGVVPDSDDEGSLDNLSNGGFDYEDERDGLASNDIHANDQAHPRSQTRQNASAKPVQTSSGVCKHGLEDLDSNTRPSEANIDDRRIFPSSSPALPPVFQVPKPLRDLELADYESEAIGNLPNAAFKHLPPVDDISTTYVRLTSPVLSPLSSFQYSQQSVTATPSVLDNHNSGESRLNLKNVNQVEAAIPITSPEPVRFSKRSLRERAPIQLHPYAMEQERYRQTLKSRGIAPMRLAQSQDEDAQRRIHVPSSDPISQDLGSDNRDEETEESQQMDFEWDLQPSPTPPTAEADLPSSQINDDIVSNDDEEFPDIDELLLRKKSTSRLVKPKLKKNIYSYEAGPPLLPRNNTRNPLFKVYKHRAVDVFDVPASPPTTSPPFPTTIRSIRRSGSQAIFMSPKETSPLDEDELNLPRTVDLPTPVTSTVKPVIDILPLDSDLDDDPFASSPSASQEEVASSSAFSSTDESVQIRKASKKMRGVLPASHLRLDQQLAKLKYPNRAHRENLSVSPENPLIRRGVALPRPPRATQVHPSSTNYGLAYRSDDSENGESDPNELITEDNNFKPLRAVLESSRIGFAEEEDRIDAMLPTLKRQRKFGSKSRKRFRVGSASLGRAYQPKITQHLIEEPAPRKQSRHKNRVENASPKPTRIQNRWPKPPRLSILDVYDPASQLSPKVPQFIKVAARTARSQIGQGRQSPSKKFIRLASRGDTLDAQSVLKEWKEGRLLPRVLRATVMSSSIASRNPLDRIADNKQTQLQPPIAKTAVHNQAKGSGYEHQVGPRQLVVSKRRQLSIKSYAPTQLMGRRPQHSESCHEPKALPGLLDRCTTKTRSPTTQLRPAQLESSHLAVSDRILNAAFKKTKKELDAQFKLSKDCPIEQRHGQLNRFLADDDIVRPSTEREPLHKAHFPALNTTVSSHVTKPVEPRKRRPQRIDIGAAQYRQPSEPLVLDDLTPAISPDPTSHDSKLVGLGKYGTRYPIHFGITALHPGVFFHESTFIGSGRFFETIKLTSTVLFNVMRRNSSFRLGNKDFRWGPWDDNVSSEVGSFLDCIIELLSQSAPPLDSTEPTPASSMEFMVDYLQRSVSFTDSASLHGFLSRMFETLKDFVARVSLLSRSSEKSMAAHWVNTIVLCSTVVLQLLLVSRSAQAQTTFQLEDLLKSVSHFCVKLLVEQGLGMLRSLYEDLQYLSFRERGIRSDHYCASGWVMIRKVLDAAQIPKASFWDIVNEFLMEDSSIFIDDARKMEQAWFCIYSILPICEFDDYGVVVPGLRHRISFDNWTIPQRLLKNVFALYSSNAKQPPGFNDYCRVLLCRCHYLIREWGWWKSNVVIGTVFDFFAAQKLGHLRNEEVYKSPRFLEELDAGPSLEVESEDRCFHVLLKVVALTIKHLGQSGDDRAIRNLVARLLPNHDRQYPRDEDVQTRDLAALRNHHDLLCTLYWASPPDCRPSLSLIQQLVDVNQSHEEACLINLRALDNLARYIFTSFTDESAAYKQFTQWELTFFDNVYQQYLSAESEVRRLAEELANSNSLPITENQVLKIAAANRKPSMNTIRILLFNLRDRIENAKDAEATLSALNPELLSKILTPKTFEVYHHIKGGFVGDAIEALHKYMDRVKILQPIGSQCGLPHTVEFDSQGSLNFADLDVERQMMIYPLHEVILPNFASITRRILESQLYGGAEPLFMERLVLCWARLVSFVTEEQLDLRGFIVNGSNAVFENRQQHATGTKYWPLFLSQLIADKSSDDLIISGFDIGLEWMQVITSNSALPNYESDLSKRLSQSGHYLLHNEKLPLHERWPKRHLHMFQVALNSIRMVSVDLNYGRFGNSYHLSEKDTKSLFSAAIKSTMDSMQRQLESMTPLSTAHTQYVKFCQGAVSHLRGYVSSILPLTDFFLQHSQYYWPKSDDPQLYAAGIVSYSLRLHNQRGKAPFELFHYLYSGWKNDLMHSRVKNHTACVMKGMRNWAFAEFVLANFVPALVLASFSTVGVVILAKTYLPIVARRSHYLLQRSGLEGCRTFSHLITILKMTVNCIRIKIQHPHTQHGHDEPISLAHRGMISIAYQFWILIRPALMEYVDAHQAERYVLDQTEMLLNVLIADLAFYFNINRDCAPLAQEQSDISTGEYVERFVAVLQDDIEKHWVVTGPGTGEWAEDAIIVKITTGAREGGSINLLLLEGIPPFNDTLELWKSSSGGITQESLDRQLQRTERGLSFPNWMMSEQVKSFPGAFRGLF